MWCSTSKDNKLQLSDVADGSDATPDGSRASSDGSGRALGAVWSEEVSLIDMQKVQWKAKPAALPAGRRGLCQCVVSVEPVPKPFVYTSVVTVRPQYLLVNYTSLTLGVREARFNRGEKLALATNTQTRGSLRAIAQWRCWLGLL